MRLLKRILSGGEKEWLKLSSPIKPTIDVAKKLMEALDRN